MKIPCLVLLLVCLLMVSCEQQAELKSGQPPPGFSLYDLQGNLVHFPRDFEGKVVAIRFWADWCPYCKTEMGEIETVYREYRNRGFVILALNVAQSKDRAAKFIGKLQISYPVLLDSDSEATRKYKVVGLPTTYFVDRHGTLQNKILGEAELNTFRDMVEQLL